jgi:hypothetical protein
MDARITAEVFNLPTYEFTNLPTSQFTNSPILQLTNSDSMFAMAATFSDACCNCHRGYLDAIVNANK